MKNAHIFIYDMSGKEVKRMEITTRGKTNLSIAGEDLVSGMYLYSLIADGKVISTERMILAKLFGNKRIKPYICNIRKINIFTFQPSKTN